MGKRKNKENNKSAAQNQDGETHNQKKVETSAAQNQEIVLKAYMHCEGCCNKVSKCLKGFDGVEEVVIDSTDQKVIVKGKNADPRKVLERLQKKFSRNVELLSPKLKDGSKDTEKKKPEKKAEVELKTLVLKMSMHCGGCAQDIKKNVERMSGILSVEPDMRNSQVVVKGAFDPPKLVECIRKRLGKYAEIVKQESEKKPVVEEINNKKQEMINAFHYPPQYSTEYIYPSQIFSDENVHSCSIM